jgi:hypothetical protein
VQELVVAVSGDQLRLHRLDVERHATSLGGPQALPGQLQIWVPPHGVHAREAALVVLGVDLRLDVPGGHAPGAAVG